MLRIQCNEKEIKFTVILASSKKEVIFFGTFTKEKECFVIKNVGENDWIRINFCNEVVVYSKRMLELNFSKSDSVSIYENIMRINYILGYQIVVNTDVIAAIGIF